jgi:hypothetical protein
MSNPKPTPTYPKDPDGKQPKLSIESAIDIADAMDVPDGAWWAVMEEMTGMDPGSIAEEIASKHRD